MSESVVGDVSTRTTPGVALWRGKSRRNTSARCIWQDELNTSSQRHTLCWLATEWSRRQQCYWSRGVYEGCFGCILASSASGLNCAAAWKLCSTSSHIRDTPRFSRLSRTWECPRRLYWMIPASWTKGHCLDSKGRAEKWEEVNSAEYNRTLTRGPATSHLGFRTPERQLEVRRLLTSAVVDSYSDWIVETCVLIERWYVFDLSNLRFFATLAQEIVTRPSCRLEQLLFVRFLSFFEG